MASLRCPACGGFLRREPASVACVACGRWAPVLDSDAEAQYQQRVLDWWLRPRSIECTSPYNHSPDGWWPAAAVRVPGTPALAKPTRRKRQAVK
jgi:hypothetical protein